MGTCPASFNDPKTLCWGVGQISACFFQTSVTEYYCYVKHGYGLLIRHRVMRLFESIKLYTLKSHALFCIFSNNFACLFSYKYGPFMNGLVMF